MIELMRLFLIYYYGSLIHDKLLSSIDNVYQLMSSEILKPMNNIILVWISKLNICF